MVFELIQLKTTFRSFGWLSSVLFGQNIFENIAIFALWCSRKDFLSICSMMEQSEMIATRVYEGGIGFGVCAWGILIFGSSPKNIFLGYYHQISSFFSTNPNKSAEKLKRMTMENRWVGCGKLFGCLQKVFVSVKRVFASMKKVSGAFVEFI